MRENSERAQAIVSKHKKDRVLLTMLESKISEALKGKQKKLDKNKNNKIDSEDFKMLRGERQDDDSMDEKSFPDLSGDGKVTMKDVLMGRGVIKGKKKKKVKEGKDNDPLRLKLLSGQRPAGTKKPKPKDVKKAVVEGLKRVCWGDRYDEGEVKQRNKAKMKKGLAKLGAGALAQEKTFTPAERAKSYETYRKGGGKEQTGNVVGKGRAKLRKKLGQADDVGTVAKRKIAKGTTGVPTGPGDKKSSRTAMKYGSQNSSIEIFGKVIREGAFKRLATARSEAGEAARKKFVKPGAMQGSKFTRTRIITTGKQGVFTGPNRGKGETPSAYKNRMRKQKPGAPGTSKPSGAGVTLDPKVPGVPVGNMPEVRRKRK
jgi:hypothetical protein